MTDQRQPGGPSPRRGLGRLPPTSRLLAFVVLSVLVTAAFTWELAFASLALGAILLVSGRAYPRTLLLGCLVTALLTFAVNTLSIGPAPGSADAPLAQVGFMTVTDATLELGLTRGARIAAMMLIAIAFVSVTSKYEMLLGVRGLGLRGSAALYAMIVLRYIDIFEHEFETTMRAVKVRGKRVDDGSLLERIRAYGSLLMPLMARAVNRAQAQALAVDARGLRGKRPAEEVAKQGPAIDVRKVGVFYGTDVPETGHLPLEVAELSVERGETVYLTGPTGSGKTTLLLTCSGLIPRSLGRMRGTVRLSGSSTRELPMTALARMARFVFANPVHGLVGITVRDELEIGLSGSGSGAPSPTEVLEIVGLDPGFLDRSTLHLSGGEMQRVQLASALMSDVSVVLLDEPTVQLDPTGKREVLEALRWLRERRDDTKRLAMIVADPSSERMLEHADRLVGLREGQLTERRRPARAAADDVAWMREARLRVPQLVRLGNALGRSLPSDVTGAAAELRAAGLVGPDAAEESETMQGPEGVTDAPAAGDGGQRTPGSVVVEADRVGFQYGSGTRALDEASCRLHAGELVFLLGSNGSGKSTLSLVLAGALDASSGTVKRPAGGHVGYVFQEPSLQILSTTVRQELAFAPRNIGRTEQQVDELVQREVARFGLDPEANPLDLSPADSRKLAVASLLTMEPAALILDEPTNGLDEGEVRDLFTYLTRLNEDGVAVMVVTHDVELACDYGSRILALHKGRIVLDGPPGSAFEHTETLRRTQVEPPPVVALSHALWPARRAALSVPELASRIKTGRPRVHQHQ